ncbi:MAG: DUF305 domain-containing protein [Gemmatimonadales bacterium]
MRPLLAVAVVLAACSGAAPAPPDATPIPVPAAGPAPAPPPATRAHTAADVHFMAGMIVHHQQAVVMARWALDSVHGTGRAVRVLSERILVGQTDEIATMEHWLAERNEPRIEHGALMPGMLTAEQLAELDGARGPAFDRLFLTSMIHHHQGALTMVDELLRAPGAAQDGLVFRFAADVHADQTAEIERMQRLLVALPSGG